MEVWVLPYEQERLPAAGRGQVSSIAGRVVRTFELLAERPLSAADLGRLLGTNRSTALRLLEELVATGAVTRDPATKRYSTVTNWFLKLVTRPTDDVNWVRRIDPLLLRMRDESEESVIFASPTDNAMVYLAYYSTPHVLALSEGVGTTRPIHCSAIGKAYLSNLPPEQARRLTMNLDFTVGTSQAAKSIEALESRLRDARRDGYALDLEESVSLVRCVAVPLNVAGTFTGAIGISGPAARLSVSRLQELGAYLKREVGQFLKTQGR